MTEAVTTDENNNGRNGSSRNSGGRDGHGSSRQVGSVIHNPAKLPARQPYDDSGILVERRRDRMNNRVAVWGLRAGIFVAFIAAWGLLVRGGIMDPTLVSRPTDVGVAFIAQLVDPTFWDDVLATFGGAMAGLAAGAVTGIILAVVFTRVPVLYTAVRPFLTLLNSLPRPALAPIFILWFGIGFTPKALVAFTMVFFLLLTSTMGALESIEHDISQLTKSLGMTKIQRFFKIEIPAALPSIIGGLRLGAVYSILGAVVAEMVGSYVGLGQRIVIATNNFQVAETFAILVAMGLLAMLVDMAVSGLHKVVSNWTR
ncbi:ABC transporter permease [Brevibacterium sediminis]|uniref:ABC transporter permease n=1 Tax=Brevibacterium sediminis TaxID=1857024 RepID=UPI0036701474